MIDARLLRTDLDALKAAMSRRNAPELITQLDDAAAVDAQLREITAERDSIRSRVNELSREVGTLRRAGDDASRERADELAAESRELGTTETNLAAEHDKLAGELRELLLRIPNIVSELAPEGAGDTDNPVVRGPFELPGHFSDAQRVPHWETGVELGILDNERAIKISRSMFSMTRGLGATLGRALCQLALDRNADAFEEVRPPSLVSTATLTATGHLPKFADDVFAIERDGLWTIPTAEVPLTSIYGGEILAEAELPLRLMAYTPCYRREAGSAGRDTRGLLRSHEFDKVEILAIATPEQSPALLDEFVARAEGIIAALGLPYRTIEICTGDLGQSHHRSFDVEVYSPGTDSWLEVSSVSWFSDYQARRANIRFRRTGQKGSEFAHTLNGSALAVPRVLAAILENYRRDDGSVAIPEALQPYRAAPSRSPAGVRDDPGVDDVADRVRQRRVQYETAGLDIGDLAVDPLTQWQRWYADAESAGVVEPNAMTIATVDETGAPDARIVLARGVDDRSVVFYTSYQSAKSSQLVASPRAAAVFAWLDLHRQVRLRGAVERVSDADSDAYFSGRPRGSQIGAWASPQSSPIVDRGELERAVSAATERFADEAVPRPPDWGGWRLNVEVAEFWQGRPNRLHDRLRYRRLSSGGWSIERLAP